MRTRQSGRRTIDAFGTCRTSRGMHSGAEFIDISAGGCRVHDPRGVLVRGDEVRIYIAGTGPHFAQVAWRDGGDAGLTFRRPLNERVLAELMRIDWHAARRDERRSHPRATPKRFL